MSSITPYEIGQKVYLLLVTGQTSQTRFEIVRVWRYPTTFRYLLDTGYVADHSELRSLEEATAEAAAAKSDEKAKEKPAKAKPDDGA